MNDQVCVRCVLNVFLTRLIPSAVIRARAMAQAKASTLREKKNTSLGLFFFTFLFRVWQETVNVTFQSSGRRSNCEKSLHFLEK